MTLDNHYLHPKLVRLYDLDSGWSVDRDYYLGLAGTALRILDLGCGTGLLCHAFAERGHRVTGVDPSAEMLHFARARDTEGRVRWIQATAQSFRCEQAFDLIVMTGHAFQVLLSEADLAATFGQIKHALASRGQFVFESRNPDYDWASCWNYELALHCDGQSVTETRRLLDFANGIMRFELTYRFPDERIVSASRLRFWQKADIEAQLETAGLEVRQCLGDWNGGAFDPLSSEEMIFHVGHA